MSYSDSISEILKRPATLLAVDANSEEVEQAGVKGMKWGVRRSEDQLDAAAASREGKGIGGDPLSGLGWAKPGAAQAAGAPPAVDGVVKISGSGVSGEYAQTELDLMAEDLTEDEKKQYEEYLKGLKPGAEPYSLIEYQLHIRSRINMKSTKDPGLLGDKSNYVDMKQLVKQGYTFSAQYELNGRDDSPGVLEPQQLRFPADRKKAKEDAEHVQRLIDERTRKHSTVKQSALEDGETIAQAGVKGMKWGVRRSEKELGRSKGSTDEDAAPAKPKASAPAKKAVKSMSDSELREALNRLQMEKQFQQLSAPEKSKNIVGEILKQTGGQVAKNVLTTVATAYIGRAVNVNLNRVLPDTYRVPIKGGDDKKD